MIRSFRVKDLNGKHTFALDLHDDLNVITGKNACGKTTMLKLAWFMISGNLERIVPEIRFRNAEIVTDTFSLALKQHESDKEGKIVLKWTFASVDGVAETGTAIPASSKLQRLNRLIVSRSGSSLFFPTFRRIEGGFSMGGRQRARFVGSNTAYVEGADEIEAALNAMAHDLSVRGHRSEDIGSCRQFPPQIS
jgi:hypothetical protein